jgi:hypothetical protein
MAKQTHEWTDGDMIAMVRKSVGVCMEKRDAMRYEAENCKAILNDDWFESYEAVVRELASFKEMLGGLER